MNSPERSEISYRPATILSSSDAKASFCSDINELECEWSTPRYSMVYRPYSAAQVVAKRSRLRVPYVAELLARKLWRALKQHQYENTALLTFGVVDTIQAIHASRHLDALLISASHASITSAHMVEPSPNLADYPLNTVPFQVEHTLKMQEFYDRKQRELAYNNVTEQIDYLKPIIADIDGGHGGITAVMRMTRMLIERGAAGIQVEDQASGSHCGAKLHGQVLVPVSEHINRLIAIRMQGDIMGCPVVIISRTDAYNAKLITSDLDKRDHYFLLGATKPLHRLVQIIEQASDFGSTHEELLESEREWLIEASLMTFPEAIANKIRSSEMHSKDEIELLVEDWKMKSYMLSLDEMKDLAKAMGFIVFWSAEHCRTQEGHYRYKGGLEAAISRAKAYSRLSDVIGLETTQPEYEELQAFSQVLLLHRPNLLLAFDYSTSYNWDARGLSSEGLQTAHYAMASLGFNLQTIKSAGVNSDALMSHLFSKDYSKRGILSYIDLIQKPEQSLGKDSMLLHQKSGAEYQNQLVQTVLHRHRRNPLIMDSHDQKAVLNLSNYKTQLLTNSAIPDELFFSNDEKKVAEQDISQKQWEVNSIMNNFLINSQKIHQSKL